MIKKLFFALCLLPSICLPVIALDRTGSTVQVNAAQIQPDGRLSIQLTESWNEGVNFNMIISTIKDFDCQTKLGTVINVQGAIGINSFNQPQNQQLSFAGNDVYGQAVNSICQGR
ncbi:hypothetical protein GNF10_10110 [Nostoc sp. UCD121]|uniref:hypothetical protein n=1 Tax=unclassified Nostoc TaxID=2593658 RepID=UPI00162ACBD9|nr:MULTISPECIES: hypothetical protein [unclassified Nostoc]MBC1222534.1 hypothetical protein [Nostoc sp. UCD120]MBC1276334.1 hypothetical protein [Nostoc sp. UCD121]MBC1295200.1 hypothetical protein [Nostoc sp. UCD122]